MGKGKREGNVTRGNTNNKTFTNALLSALRSHFTRRS